MSVARRPHGHVIVIAGPELQLTGALEGDRTIAVEFYLANPSIIVRQ